MAVTLLALSNFTWGIANDETGINIEKLQVVANSKKVEVPNKSGETRGVVFYDQTEKITLDGETILASGALQGVAAATFAAAFTLANSVNLAGISVGDILLDEMTLDLTRDALQKISISATRYPLITV